MVFSQGNSLCYKMFFREIKGLFLGPRDTLNPLLTEQSYVNSTYC